MSGTKILGLSTSFLRQGQGSREFIAFLTYLPFIAVLRVYHKVVSPLGDGFPYLAVAGSLSVLLDTFDAFLVKERFTAQYFIFDFR